MPFLNGTPLISMTQELAWDEIDRLGAYPPRKRESSSEVVYEKEGRRHYIFIRFAINANRTILTIVGVGKHIMP